MFTPVQSSFHFRHVVKCAAGLKPFNLCLVKSVIQGEHIFTAIRMGDFTGYWLKTSDNSA